jgi:hypothetical protein
MSQNALECIKIYLSSYWGRYGGPHKGLECLEVMPNMWTLQLHPEETEQTLTKNMDFYQVGY